MGKTQPRLENRLIELVGGLWKDIAFFGLSALIGVVTSYYFFKKQKQKRSLGYTSVYNKLFGEDISKHVLYDFRWGPFAIENPFHIRLIVWNDGNETLTQTDLSTTNPLTANFSDSFIIAARWTSISNLAISPRLDVDGATGKIGIQFEFLEPNSGFAMDVVLDHKGDSKYPIVFLNGSVRGSKVKSRYRPSGFSGRKFALIACLFLLMAASSLSGLVPLVSLFSQVDHNVFAVASTLTAIGAVASAFTFFVAATIFWPRTYFPDMIGLTMGDVAVFSGLTSSQKWRVATDSLAAYGLNSKVQSGHNEQ